MANTRAKRRKPSPSSTLSENSTTFATPITSKHIDIESEQSTRKSSRRKDLKRPAYDEASDSPIPVSPTLQDMPPKKRQPVRGNWSASHLLTNPKSKFTTINLPDLLSQERAWTALTRAEQLELISLLPGVAAPEVTDDQAIPNIPRDLLKNNSAFLSDVRLLQEDLSAGRYEPVWLQDAKNAMEMRSQGAFDDWKDQNREEFWGQKQKIDWNALAGESSKHSLPTLVKAGYVSIGDRWLLLIAQRKNEKGDKGQIVVEKEATVTEISEDYTLSFSFPPGMNKYSTPANGEDLTVSYVSNPTTIHEAMMQEDGRLAGVRRGNTWKDLRCSRKNQEMGSLWDIRELYHQRQTRDIGI